jgi:hypothetical protein
LHRLALLLQGAKAAVMSADKRDNPFSRWLVQLKSVMTTLSSATQA